MQQHAAGGVFVLTARNLTHIFQQQNPQTSDVFLLHCHGLSRQMMYIFMLDICVLDIFTEITFFLVQCKQLGIKVCTLHAE